MYSGHATRCPTVVAQQLAGRVGAGHAGEFEDGAVHAGRVARAVVVRAALSVTADKVLCQTTGRSTQIRPLDEMRTWPPS